MIFTSAGTFSFAATSQDPAHYNVYFWPASAGATNFSNPPADYLTNHGGTTLLVGTDGTVYLAAGSNGVSNWYKWVAAGSSGSWVPYGSTSPAPSTTQYNPAWAQVLTVGQGANAVSNIWYMTACDDFTNVWNAVDAKNRAANDSPQKFEVQLPHYPGTTDIPNNDFAHLLGSPYLSYFGVAPF